ncbi:MAG TPA: AlpA family phage regulatory protein [Caulobacterales bacterium]|nr:AlpA family phage regulatory protein [Caulobacterales bacterium]
MQSDIPDLVNEGEARAIIGGAKTPISRATLWRGVKSGRYPKPLKVGVSSNRWKRGELIAVVEKADAARGVAA